MVTVKAKGQGHLKTKVKVKQNNENSFLHNFMVKLLTHGAYSGSCHSSKVKSQGHLKVKFGAIFSYSMIIKHFIVRLSPFECWCDISSDYYI